MARADLVDYWQALSIVQYLETEQHYAPWLTAFNNLIYIARRLNSTELNIYKVKFRKDRNKHYLQKTHLILETHN